MSNIPYNIKEQDIQKFHKIVKDLNTLIEKIRKYEPSAHVYVTPNQINLMEGYGNCMGQGPLEKFGDERLVAQQVVLHLDCGDW